MPAGKPVMKQEWADTKARLASIKPEQRQYKKAQATLAAMAEDDYKKQLTAALLELAKVQQELGLPGQGIFIS